MTIHESVTRSAIRVKPAAVSREGHLLAASRRVWAALGLILAAVLATHLIDFGVYNLKIGLLNATSDSSWSHLLTSCLLVGATVLTIVAARQATRERGLWTTAAVLFAFLAVDEISPLHAQVDEMAWGKLLYVPLLLALCASLWSLSVDEGRFGLIRIGLVTLIASYGIHVLGPHVLSALGLGSETWAYQTKVGVKAGTELAGWTLVVCGLGTIITRITYRRGRGA